jgi:hypothetical protein
VGDSEDFGTRENRGTSLTSVGSNAAIAGCTLGNWLSTDGQFMV